MLEFNEESVTTQNMRPERKRRLLSEKGGENAKRFMLSFVPNEYDIRGRDKSV